MTVEFQSDQAARLQQLATEYHRSPDDLVRESVDHYLAYEEAMVEAIKRGDAEIAAGQLIEHAEVVARIMARFSPK
jgi:predicted transcriptional regulator